MKLAISKEQLIVGLQAVQNVVSTRTTLPILSNVLLNAGDDRVELTATDLDVTVSCSVEAKVAKPGAVTLPVKRFFGIVRELGASELQLDVDDKHSCALECGASFFRINGMAPEEFPPVPNFKETRAVVLPQEKLRSMLRKTSYAISTDETRFVLNGIFFSVKENKVTMVATDGRRLALVDEEAEGLEGVSLEFIVPTKAVNELSRLLQGSGDIEVRPRENQVAFNLRGEGGLAVVVISKLVEGNYPNYRQVIPTQVKERVPIVREELLQALKRAEIMTSEKSNSVKLTFAKNSLAIMANTPDVGEARESLAINYKGKDMAIAFNPGYLMDPLRALDNDEVFLELIDELSPGVLKINGPFLYVLMPMRMS
ncbi:MAG: DNA polymerase III subunit beta [Verrucomicrobia bacterium]|nr:DNA polymerase III subunit beta [Verrucomicrobiota bacterium]